MNTVSLHNHSADTCNHICICKKDQDLSRVGSLSSKRRENFNEFLRPGYGGPFSIRDDCGARRTLESLSDWVRGYDFETKAEWYAVERRWEQVLFLCIGGWCGDMTRIPLGEKATGATKW